MPKRYSLLSDEEEEGQDMAVSSTTSSSRSSQSGEKSPDNNSGGDPFYLYKDELASKVASLERKLRAWANDPDSVQPTDIQRKLGSADSSLEFLEQTVQMVQSNRDQFKHIDDKELTSRRQAVDTIRAKLRNISEKLSIASGIEPSLSARNRSVNRKAKEDAPEDTATPKLSSKNPFVENTSSNESEVNSKNNGSDNDGFVATEQLRQQVIMEEQDENLEQLGASVSHLGHIAVGINQEIKEQNKMLDALSEDVDETQERMHFVLDRMSRLLKTKDKCQLGTILFLTVVLVVMVFLVAYT